MRVVPSTGELIESSQFLSELGGVRAFPGLHGGERRGLFDEDSPQPLAADGLDRSLVDERLPEEAEGPAGGGRSRATHPRVR